MTIIKFISIYLYYKVGMRILNGNMAHDCFPYEICHMQYQLFAYMVLMKCGILRVTSAFNICEF